MTHSLSTPPAARALTPRQIEILDRAAELVSESGLAQLTMKRLAERVGFTEPALYRHCAGKSALLAAMVERLGGGLVQTMQELAGNCEIAARDRLLAMVRHHVGMLRATRGLPILILAEGLASGDQQIIETIGGILRRYIGLLEAVLGELGLELGVAPQRQVMLFLGLPAALGLQMRAFPEHSLTDDEVDRLVRHYVLALTRATSEIRP